MSKSTKSPAPATNLAGKTAEELRGFLTAKATTKAAVIAFLREREAAGKLRAPSAKLLAELTGTAPVAAPSEAPAKATKPEPTLTGELVSSLVKRIAALEAEVAAMRAPAKVEVAAPAKADEPKAPAKARKAKADDRPTESDVREGLAECSLAELREQAADDVEGAAKMGKKALIDAMVASAIEDGIIVAATPVAVAAKPGKPDLKIVADDVSAVF